MRALTFKGYLLSQLQELSGVGGTSLYSFSKLAENNFRLKDALCLYLMMFTDKNLKNKLLKKYDYLNDGCEKLSGITDNNVEKYVSEKELSEYKTIYDNYLYRLNKHNNETKIKTSVYKGYKQDKIEMRGDRAEMSDFPLYLNMVAGGLDRRDQTIGGFSFVVKIYALPVVEIIG